MAEIIEEPSALSKIIPVSFKINDTDSVTTTRLATKKQFNTTDTDAWLSFTLDGIDANMTGEFDITMVNVDENPSSIINRTNLPFSAIPFHYKIDASADVEKNQIRHAGRWIGQVIIRLANGDTTTRQFDFAIVGHLLDGKEARLILIEDYNALMATISESKQALDQYNVDYAVLLADITDAEALRVQEYNALLAAQQANIEAFDVALDQGIVAENLAEKLQNFEATNNSRLLSAEQQLEQAVTVSNTASSKADAMASGSPKGVYTTLTDLQTAFPTGTTGAYLVSADGKWYYWSGSAWAIGGVYQAATFKTYKRSLTASDNIDDLKSEGQYWMAKATTTLGTYPAELSQYAMVNIESVGTNYIVQQITNLRTATPQQWIRTYVNAWSEWVETTVTQVLKNDIIKLKQDVNGFPIILRELPNGVKDTFVDNQDGTYTLTQNVKVDTLVDASVYGLVTTTVNIDYVRLNKPLDYIGSGNGNAIAGNMVLEGTLGDKAYADSINNIGYISSVSNGLYGPVVAKGTYADVAAVKAALVGKKITYQLTTPIVHTITQAATTNTLQIAKLTSAMDGVLNTYATRPWQGKVANFLGDSITEGATVDGSYVPVVKDLLGLSVANNYGIGGGRLCKTTPEIDALYTPLIDRYTQIDMTADIIFVLIGTNDYASQVPIGATDSASTSEFKGALNIMMDWFRINFPDKLVIFSTLLHRYNDNSLTIKMSEYRAAIKERCDAKHFVCYDAYANTGFDFGAGYYDHILTADGLHPNAAGNTIFGRKIAGFINAQ